MQFPLPHADIIALVNLLKEGHYIQFASWPTMFIFTTHRPLIGLLDAMPVAPMFINKATHIEYNILEYISVMRVWMRVDVNNFTYIYHK